MKAICIILISLGLYADDIDISFGCYDCKDKQKIVYEKEVEKYTKKASKITDKIEIDGTIEIAFEKSKNK